MRMYFRLVAGFLLLSGFAFGASQALALKVEEPRPWLHDRFYTGGNKAFIGEGYDFSGIARNMNGSMKVWATMISPRHFISSRHAHPVEKHVLRFYHTNDPQGSYEEHVVLGGTNVGTGDVWVGVLETPVSDRVAKYPLAVLDDFKDYEGKEFFVVGRSHSNFPNLALSQRMGKAVVGTAASSRTVKGTVESAIRWTGKGNQLGGNHAITEHGDSGAPSLMPFNGRLTLLGQHAGVNNDNLIPLYVEGINKVLEFRNEKVEVLRPEPETVATVDFPTVGGKPQTNMAFDHLRDIVYGYDSGMALIMDVLTPERQNGAAVFLIVSGGFFSSRDMLNMELIRPFLNGGYTVFAVMHGSQPKFHIDEIMVQVPKAVRFVRYQADRFGVDPQKFAAVGASSGGHLALMLATTGEPGDTESKDPVARISSEVQAAAAFFPPTDFLNYGRAGEDAVGVGVLAGFKGAFGPQADTAEGRRALGPRISPVTYLAAGTPPILLIHGDKDELVPLQQSELFAKNAESVGAVVELRVREGKAHGWDGMEKELSAFVEWFDKQLFENGR